MCAVADATHQVALAIIMHKAPAAFGLCTYLLNTGWGLGRTRRAMAVFSLASPLSALLVYVTISSLPMLNQPMSVPLCLLLSGGTFLYAACIHVLPETVVGRGAGKGKPRHRAL